MAPADPERWMMDKLPGNRLKPADFFIEMCTGACDLDEIAWAEDVIWFPLTSLVSHRFLGWAGLEEFTLISPVLNPLLLSLSPPPGKSSNRLLL